MKNNDYVLMAKLRNKIENYLSIKYPIKNIHIFSVENRDIYLESLDKVLTDVNDTSLTNFIFPNGKKKRIEFDLSGLYINEAYRLRFDINEKTLNERFIIPHESVKYLGFNLDDILLAGCFRIGYNKINNECYIHYNSKLFLPTKYIIDVIEELLIMGETVMLANETLGIILEEKFKSFSYKKGDTIKDIKKFINENR